MRRSTTSANYMLGLLVLVYMSNYLDRVIIGVLSESIKIDLAISDSQIGLLNGLAFVLLYTLLGIPLARLAERTSRKWLISICLCIWSGMTVLGGLTTTFGQLLATRMGVAAGEAGCTPSAHSIISDSYPPHRRSLAISIYSAGIPLGIIVGSLAGGWIAQNMGWRTALIAVGAPGLILALVILTTTKEPERGRFDNIAADDVPSIWVALRTFAKDRVFLNIVFGISAAAIGIFGISAFIVPVLIRGYGLDVFQAATIFGLTWGIAGILGSISGGAITDWAAARNQRWYGAVPAIGYLLGCPLLVMALYQSDWRYFIVPFFLGSMSVNIALAPTVAVVHNRVHPRMRASASAVILLMTSLVGQGVGPTLVGVLSDTFGAAHLRAEGLVGSFASACSTGRSGVGVTNEITNVCQQASFLGLRDALTVVMFFFAWGALHYAFVTLFLGKAKSGYGAPLAGSAG